MPRQTDCRSISHRPRIVLTAGLLWLAAACGGDPPTPADAAEPEEETLRAGEVAAIHLDSAALAMAGIELGEVETVRSTALPVTGTITYDQNRVSHIGPRTGGRISDLRVDLGDRVAPGAVLAVLESPEVGATRAELHEAEALLEIATENYERERRLEEQGISSRRELLDAEGALRQAQAALQSATERLRALGARAGEGSQFTVTAPFAGVVVEKHATRGEVVSPSDQLFTVSNLSRLWIELDIYERDLRLVASGQPVTVTTAAYPNQAFDGTIVYVGDILDPERRTVRARVELDNPDGSLKPGMFATATIRVEGMAEVLVVPRSAVQTLEDGAMVVWVPGDEPGEFRARAIETGELIQGDRIEVHSGLEESDRIVVEGAFTLKAELSRGEFGGHEH